MDSVFQLFERVENKHGWMLVSHALSYITASKNGVSEPEIEDFISLDVWKSVPKKDDSPLLCAEQLASSMCVDHLPPWLLTVDQQYVTKPLYSLQLLKGGGRVEEGFKNGNIVERDVTAH